MALQVWLPFTDGTLKQQGLNNASATVGGTVNLTNTGKLGKCATIGTAAGGVTLPASTMTSFTECSVAFWIKIISWNTSYATFFQAGLGSTPWNNYIFGILRNNQNSNLCFTLTNSNGSSSQASYVTSNLNTGQWYHLVFTYKAGTICTYIDGLLDKTYSTTYVPNFAGITHISIGRCTNNSGYQTNCGLNDFRIYDHCLSQMEVKELAKGLVLHYPLNRGGWGQENLLARYVVPGMAAPTSTAAGGRTTWLGDYKITIPAIENADTYFRLFTTKQLTTNATYTISCNVDGLLSGSYYRFPLYAQGNTAMGVLNLDHNGLCSLTFTMTYGTQTAATGANGETVYICFMDDSSRAIASGQGAITISNFKLEEGSIATPWCPNSSDALATTMGLNGTTEYDCSGFCNNGTRTGTFTYVSDTPKYSVSQQFSGSQYIQLPFPCSKISEAVTVAVWGYESNWNTSSAERLIGAATNSSGWCIGDYGSENTLFAFYANGSYNTAIGFKQLSAGWHHFVITFDGLHLNYYVDGQLFSSKTFSTKQIATGNYNIEIGRHYGDSCNFKGRMSDARIYATALSASDVKSLYQNCATIDPDGTIRGQIRS